MKSARQPNLVVFMAEGMPAGAIAGLGCRGIHTPNLDRLAARSAGFTNAYCTQPVCTPARASLFTGGYPHTIPCPDNEHRLPPAAKCLPEWADFSTYRTAMIGKWDLGDEPRVQHGFAHWRSIDASRHNHYSSAYGSSVETHYERFLLEQGYSPDLPLGRRGNNPHSWFTRPVNIPERLSPDAYVASEAVSFIQAATPDPFMLWLPFLRCKPPVFDQEDAIYLPADMPLSDTFDAPPSADRHLKERLVAFLQRHRTPENWRSAIARNWAQVTLIDRYVGQVLDAIEAAGRSGETIVVFTGDHGFMHGEHRMSGKCVMLEAAIKTPMLVHIPGVTDAGQRIEAPFSHADLLPTLLTAMEKTVPAELPGTNWMPVLRGPVAPTNRDMVIQWNVQGGKGEFRTLLHHVTEEIGPRWQGPDLVEIAEAWTEPLRTLIAVDGWKYTHSPIRGEHLLVNLRDDPGERRNLVRDPHHQARLADLRDRLSAWQTQTGDAMRGEPRCPQAWTRFVEEE